MTDLSIRVDAAQAIGLMGRISDNYKYAEAAALNRTGEEVNIALQREARARMIFRGKQGQAVLNWYAPTKLPAILRAKPGKHYVTPVMPEGPGKILRPFETGAPKTTDRSGRVPAIPTKAIRPWPGASIPAKYYPTNLYPESRLGMAPARLKNGKIKRSKSYKEVRPFVIQPGFGPKWGIYQRVGPGRGKLRLLWAYQPVVPRPKTLDTYNTARRVVAQQWGPNMTGMFRAIVRSPAGRASLLDLAV